MAAFCTLVGALGRPFGGALADRLGGIRALGIFYSVAGVAMVLAAMFAEPLALRRGVLRRLRRVRHVQRLGLSNCSRSASRRTSA